MSTWTHAVCDGCYFGREFALTLPGGPYRVRMHDACCFCGARTGGIYLRIDPATPGLRCSHE